jgi:hypothetical protein
MVKVKDVNQKFCRECCAAFNENQGKCLALVTAENGGDAPCPFPDIEARLSVFRPSSKKRGRR